MNAPPDTDGANAVNSRRGRYYFAFAFAFASVLRSNLGSSPDDGFEKLRRGEPPPHSFRAPCRSSSRVYPNPVAARFAGMPARTPSGLDETVSQSKAQSKPPNTHAFTSHRRWGTRASDAGAATPVRASSHDRDASVVDAWRRTPAQRCVAASRYQAARGPRLSAHSGASRVSASVQGCRRTRRAREAGRGARRIVRRAHSAHRARPFRGVARFAAGLAQIE